MSYYARNTSSRSTLTQVSVNRCFDGEQHYYRHQSSSTNTPMTFSIYLPDEALAGRLCPAVLYLSGLTCNADNVTHKAHFQQKCSELGMIFIAPDTSPRSDAEGTIDVADDERFFVGQGAGYYVNATQAPWSEHYQMQSYIVDELYDLLRSEFAIGSIGIMGHSMGGHGALLLGFTYPSKFISVSAIAPLCAASESTWGEVAYQAYFGDDKDQWDAADASKVITKAGRQYSQILVDQGGADDFYNQGELQPEKLQAACQAAGQPLTLRYQAEYDHSYYFIQSVIGEHIEHHWRMAQLN
ncbi:S-formylglutathione hydrolase [Psychrobacter aestuarii]|uniref:S-formylglutathione hydrolase n=1 Tax=Psychrobacter aestuarii TaxID=556327 RepID=A0ABN0VVL0_9GAMM|nr:S-formylglutathione hydrolase [Psychrobacter aestuarii]